MEARITGRHGRIHYVDLTHLNESVHTLNLLNVACLVFQIDIQFPGCICRWQGISSFLGEKNSGATPPNPKVQGLYMYGGVGTGKTMLMDLLVASAPPHFKVSRSLPPRSAGWPKGL
jgi:predicted ATPase